MYIKSIIAVVLIICIAELAIATNNFDMINSNVLICKNKERSKILNQKSFLKLIHNRQTEFVDLCGYNLSNINFSKINLYKINLPLRG